MPEIYMPNKRMNQDNPDWAPSGLFLDAVTKSQLKQAKNAEIK